MAAATKGDGRRCIRGGIALIFLLAGTTLVAFTLPQAQPASAPTPPAIAGPGALTGVVRDDRGPVAGAVVRVQTTNHATQTGPDGTFSLVAPGDGPFRLTAWAPGYLNSGTVEATPGQAGVELVLVAHTRGDNPGYAWRAPKHGVVESADILCADCHSSEGTDLPFTLPVDEWSLDAHSGSATNPRFLSMYRGTDLQGNRSQPTRYAYLRDYGRIPLRPDPLGPYYGPGYKLDFPDTAGNCAACHAPAAAVNAPYDTDPTRVSGVEATGVSCDFCHKVWDVKLDPSSGMPYDNMPGVLSFEFRRPPEGHQFFAGPYDDVTAGEDTYSPLQGQSQFCAPCHRASFWGTTIYNSFGEWLASPYSRSDTGKSCQDCHMPPLGATRFARPDKGGLERDPATIFSHRMPGAADEELLRNAVSMAASARLEGNSVVVQVDILNDRTGHHVPTDSPLRHLILLVKATGSDGRPLIQTGGPTVPEWGGVGEPEKGYYAGLPGKGFAKVLEELWTEVSPTAAYWNTTRILGDNRIAAFATDDSVYTFAAPPGGGEVTVESRLLFRRAFIEVADQKGWSIPDIVMAEERVPVSFSGK